MLASADQDYTPSTLHESYQIDLSEAKRLITSFGSNRHELDRLLGSRDRTQDRVDVELLDTV